MRSTVKYHYFRVIEWFPRPLPGALNLVIIPQKCLAQHSLSLSVLASAWRYPLVWTRVRRVERRRALDTHTHKEAGKEACFRHTHTHTGI